MKKKIIESISTQTVQKRIDQLVKEREMVRRQLAGYDGAIQSLAELLKPAPPEKNDSEAA